METVRYVVRRFVEFHGDIPITDVKIAHLREYAEKAIRVPTSTSPRIRQLPIMDAIKWVESERAQTISERTLKGHIAHLKSLTAFATPQVYMEIYPFAGFKPVQKRREFSTDCEAIVSFLAETRRLIELATKTGLGRKLTNLTDRPITTMGRKSELSSMEGWNRLCVSAMDYGIAIVTFNGSRWP